MNAPAVVGSVGHPLTAISSSANQQGLTAGAGTPSDSTGAIGPIHYLEMTNSQVGQFDRTLAAPLAAAQLSAFLGTAAGYAAADPQVQWDQQAGRWLYSGLEYGSILVNGRQTPDNYIAYGWSKAGDTTLLTLNNTDWCNFHVHTTTSLYDFPKLGHDANFIEIGANVYPNSTVPFSNGALIVVPKPAPADTTCTPINAQVFNLGSTTFTPVPSNTADSAGMGYVSAISPTAMGVWHVSLTAIGLACPVPPCLVADGSIPITPWNYPPGPNDWTVPQPGGNPSIDALDGRLTQAVQATDPGAGGAEAVWTQHTVAAGSGRTMVSWYELVPSLCSGGVCPPAAKRQEGLLSDPNLYLFNAAISPTSHGDAAVINYNTGSSTTYVDVRAQSHDAADPSGTMSGELTLRGSTVADTDFSCSSPYGPPCRWGDYPAASPDPTDCSLVWGTSMLNGNVASSGGRPAWVTQNFALSEGMVRSSVSKQQYVLQGSDGQTWNDIDTSLLRLGSSRCTSSTALITANADLWTAKGGVNQDIGIFVDVDGTQSTSPIAWKESGGFNGTYSPNAAYVQALYPMPAGHTYTVRLKWKSNVPTAGWLYAGAGPLASGGYSPTRLTVRYYATPPSESVMTMQASDKGSDGVTWKPVPGLAPLALNPASDSRVILGGNADLWTDTAGYNQDIGITLNGALIAWKESGGFNGTYSPNAAFVQATANLTGSQSYTAQLVWKTNVPSPASATIYAGAGPWPAGTSGFSPTSLIAVTLPAGANPAEAATVTQTSLTNSDGVTWSSLNITKSVAPSTSTYSVVSANADLWTASAGYNQDLAIFVSDNNGPLQLLAWKESGGFGGTLSPNAAFAETVFPMTAGDTYVFSLWWKTNRSTNNSGATIYLGAGPINGSYSPTRLLIDEIS